MGKNMLTPSGIKVIIIRDVCKVEYRLLLEEEVWGGISVAARR